jgi:hypothetical protein
MDQPRGQIFVECKPDKQTDPLLKDSIFVTVAANGGSGTLATAIGGANGFTVPKGRGYVVGIDIFVADTTIATWDGNSITLTANGVSILDGSSMMPYTYLFQNSRKPMMITIPESAVISGQIVNDSNTAYLVQIDLLFYNPYFYR